MGYLLLGIAIATEIVGTLSLRASDGFSKPGWAALVVLGYGTAFVLLAAALRRDVPLAVAYTIWGGIGIAAVALLSVPLFGERLSSVQVAGVALVICGVLAIEAGTQH